MVVEACRNKDLTTERTEITEIKKDFLSVLRALRGEIFLLFARPIIDEPGHKNFTLRD
jgi:hypothetical protein